MLTKVKEFLRGLDKPKWWEKGYEVIDVTVPSESTSQYPKMNSYQDFVRDMVVYEDQFAYEYLHLGLIGEIGELYGKLAKRLRDRPSELPDRQDIKSELGDILWFVAALADHYDLKLADVAAANMEKLTDRRERAVLKGDGDNR